MTNQKLTEGHKHILSLVRRDGNAEGWTAVSKVVAPVFTNKNIPGGAIPQELCEFESNTEGGGRARLTQMGKNILDAMAWL